MANLNYFIENDLETALKHHKEILIEAKFIEDDYRIAYRVGFLRRDYWNGAEFFASLNGLPEDIGNCEIRELDVDPVGNLHIYLKNIMDYNEFKNLKGFKCNKGSKAESYEARIAKLFEERS